MPNLIAVSIILREHIDEAIEVIITFLKWAWLLIAELLVIMAIALGSKFVYNGESEEEVIPQRALDEGMWASDDEEDDEFDNRTLRAVTSATPAAGSKGRTRSGFWGSFFKKVKRKTTRKKSKTPALKTP